MSTFRPLTPLVDVSDKNLAPGACPEVSEPSRWTTDDAAEPRLTDEGFDSLLDAEWQGFSVVHWTPANVARYAAMLLAPSANEQVLDVGSGVGKFCILGALATRGTFVGIEQRAHLTLAAKATASRAGATRATFVTGDALELDWTPYSALYFFNPFIEAKFPDDDRIDDTIQFGIDRYTECLVRTAAKLSAMASGTRVAIYYALGVPMPPGYALLWEEWMGEGRLSLWLRE